MDVKINTEKKIVSIYSPEIVQLLKDHNIQFEAWEIKFTKELKENISDDSPLISISQSLYTTLSQIAEGLNLSIGKCATRFLKRDIEFIRACIKRGVFEEIIGYYETEVERDKLRKVFKGDDSEN